MKYPVQKKYHNFKKRRENIRDHKPPVNRMIAVPSFFTLMNLFSGFLSIISVADGELERGAWLIVIAGLFDVLDGMMARLAHANSDFGIELDSLSDMVSFGVAPGFLIYTFSLHELGTLGMIIAAVPPLLGAVRLARFNVNARLHPTASHFTGLPIPSVAIIIIAFFLTFKEDLDIFDFFNNGVNTVLIPLIVSVSLLMVSTVQFEKIPRFDKETVRDKKWTFVLFFFYMVLIVTARQYGLMSVIIIYITKASIEAAIKFFSADYTGEEDLVEDFS